MGDRLSRIVIAVLLVVLAVYFAQPYVDRWMFSASTPRAVEPRGSLSDIERTSIEIFEHASPSVVQVVGRAGTLETPEAENGTAQSGSGFVWDGAGHIVTNDHVVEGTSSLAVRFASGQVLRAQVVGTAPNYDLAVIRVDVPRSLPPPIAIGTSDALKVGQWVFAIGNPFGLDQSLTTGIISALKRRLPTSVIGVNTAILSPSGTSAGIGLAIPIDSVNRVVPELIRRGSVPTPGIGIVAASEAAATRAGVQGVVIVRTAPGSSAERAGLRGMDPSTGKPGDVIVAVDGKPVRGLADLIQELERVGVGKRVTLTVQRDGREVPVEVDVMDIGRRG